ncbi:MAG TPA: NfeD family protein [Solirubrobacterales bacterium]|nr:NfeD family protein [Solirubrobacterales bacterium]
MALVIGFILFAILDPPLGVIVLVAAAVIEVGEAIFWTRYLKRFRVKTGAEGMIGERAETIEPCEPRGRVRLRGEIWDAVCERGAGVGEAVRIVAVRGLTLEIEPLEPAGLEGPGQPQRR